MQEEIIKSNVVHIKDNNVFSVMNSVVQLFAYVQYIHGQNNI